MSDKNHDQRSEKTTVYVVDDDPAVRDALTLLLEGDNVEVLSFGSAETFLAARPSAPRSCAILDVRMPGMDGIRLHAEMLRLGFHVPVIFLTGHGDVQMTVRAIKAGAVDFLVKPVKGDELRKSLDAALIEGQRWNQRVEANESAVARVRSLTERERDVLKLVVLGHANKEIARLLGISHRTVEIHRARIMHKTGTSTLLELARVVEDSDLRV